MGQDVHRQTAAEMFGVPEDQVTPEQLHAARIANFGTLYGRGPNLQNLPIRTPEGPRIRDLFKQKK